MCSRDGSPAAQTLNLSTVLPVADMHVAISAVLSKMQAQVLRGAWLVPEVLCPKAWQDESNLSAEKLQFQIRSVTAVSHVCFSMLSRKTHPVIPSENSMQA